ncbi:hypothetical protein EPUL_005423, partial [Erysiphe pulchra]
MLCAFKAHPIIELKVRDKSKIESILAYGDRLIVGLNTGNLRIYRVNEPFDKSVNVPELSKKIKSSVASKAIDLLREVEKFSTKSIEQLAIIKESNILISLSNAYVSIHDLHSFTLQEQLTKTKGVTSFATTSNIIKDSITGIPEIISRLAVCVKRKLLVWSWHESEMEQDTIEVILTEPIRVLQWAEATKVICGLNSGFVIVDVITKSIDDVTGYGAMGGTSAVISGGRFGSVGTASIGYMGLKGYTSRPLVAKLVDGQILLAKDTNSLFITSEGKSLDKGQIPWQQVPEAIGYSYPYILALQSPSQGMLEVRNPETLSLLQTITLQNAKQLYFPASTVSLAHAGKDFHVASERCVWRMHSTDYYSQIDELLQNEEYDEAISILNILEDALFNKKAERLRDIKIQKAQKLFDKKMYQNAIDIFMAQDVQAPPERVIKLYPQVIAGNISIFESKSPENNDEIKDQIEPRTEEAQIDMDMNGVSETNKAVDSVKSTVVNKILKNHLKSASDTSSICSSKRIDSGDLSDATFTAGPQIDSIIEGKDLNNAVLALIGFLVQARNRMKAFLDTETGKIKPTEHFVLNSQNGQLQHDIESLFAAPESSNGKNIEEKLRDIATLIDTTLFRSYVLVRPQLAGALFRIPNFCDPEVVKENLLKSSRHNDLVDFFYGKRLHRPALELLKHFGMSTESDVPDVLRGPRRTIGYLQNLPPEMIDLILEFAEWPLRANSELGMEIFIADTENAETLPRKKVVNFLQGIDEKLAIKYLEHIIGELNDLTPDFHNQLLEAYLKELTRGAKKQRNTEEWKELLIKLIKFMTTSCQYSLGKAFNLIPKDDPDFYEAEVVVLNSMGQHKKALEIYVFKTKDYRKAEEYCNNVYLSSHKKDTRSNFNLGKAPASASSEKEKQSDSISIFHTLLSLYLTPPRPHLPNLSFALHLLSNHGFRLPASSTLSLIPDSVPVASLESYFRGQIRAANSKVNESRVVAGLHKSEVVNVQAHLLLGEDWSISALKNDISSPNPLKLGCRSRRVAISEDRVCPGCYKRLGNSIITVMPNDAVLHY